MNSTKIISLSFSSPPPTYDNEPLVVTTQQPVPVGVSVDCTGFIPDRKFLTHENNKATLQRSRSRQNINAGSAAVKATPAKEAHNESEGHPSAARAKAASCSESGRRYRNTPGHSYWLDRERVVDREMVRPTEKEREVEAEPSAIQPSSTDATVSSCTTNGESDVEALLAKLRAL
ncbi:hypothetical protein L3Q82_008697 [Scortum barcoo]|uniref:Uncharacterized protein n=1 Tax=Scortum barcoo TaxID=214431 RepID=A0ACB8XCC9_9TELE|nr:hypothetical protein L3Q82_008697 [Scortum barcoo]